MRPSAQAVTLEGSARAGGDPLSVFLFLFCFLPFVFLFSVIPACGLCAAAGSWRVTCPAGERLRCERAHIEIHTVKRHERRFVHESLSASCALPCGGQRAKWRGGASRHDVCLLVYLDAAARSEKRSAHAHMRTGRRACSSRMVAPPLPMTSPTRRDGTLMMTEPWPAGTACERQSRWGGIQAPFFQPQRTRCS